MLAEVSEPHWFEQYVRDEYCPIIETTYTLPSHIPSHIPSSHVRSATHLSASYPREIGKGLHRIIAPQC